MKSFSIFLGIFAAYLSYKLYDNASFATFGYIAISYLASFDKDNIRVKNYDNEIEDSIFTHRFIHINQTFGGFPVDATYHIVECGNPTAEPIVFGHGLAENWKVWKNVMVDFCSTHRAIAVDCEGMGQSIWPNVISDVPSGKSRAFMADMQMEMLRKIGVRCFNLVITDYTFWSTLSMLREYGADTILRYGKLQSVYKYNNYHYSI